MFRVCEAQPGFADVTKAVVVRDLYGRVHLALQHDRDAGPDPKALASALQREIGAWFVGPILGGGRISPQFARLRGTVLDQHAPREGAWFDPITGERRATSPGKWHVVERRLSKLAWTDEKTAMLPWPLRDQRPAIVTFFSFKGGVGRTTLLASVAMQLAREGKRVVAIDLDVEAPGLADLLDAAAPRGVLDFLVDHYATGTVDIADLFSPAKALDGEARFIDVVPAGNLDENYFEKLARLDFVGSGMVEPDAPSPVRAGLVALLEAISRREPRPDYILIDSRAGLHDVAGLSLHDLAHVDVLVGRDSEQGYRGLELTVAALGQRRQLADIRCVVVQSMAPDDPGTDEYRRVTAEYRQRSYDAFSRSIYSKDEDERDGADPERDAPAADDPAAAHHPSVIRFDQRLVRFSALRERRAELTGPDYVGVKERIAELCAPESDAQGEE